MLPTLTSPRFRKALEATLRDDPAVQGSLQAYVQVPAYETLLNEGLRAGRHEVEGWLALRFTHEQPLLAARVVNLAARSFQESRSAPLDAQILAPLEAAEAARLALLTRAPELTDAERHRDALAREVLASAERVARLEGAGVVLAAQREALGANDLEPIEARQGIRRTQQQLDRTRVERNALATRYGPRHQRMIAANEAVSTARALLQEEIAVAGVELDRRIAANLAQAEGVRTAYRRAMDAAASFDQKRAELAELDLAVEQAQRRLQSARVEGAGVVEADVPTTPDRPAHLRWLAIVFAGVLLSALVLQRLIR